MLKISIIILFLVNSAHAQSIKCNETKEQDVAQWTKDSPVIELCILHRWQAKAWKQAYFEQQLVYDQFLKLKQERIKKLLKRVKNLKIKLREQRD
jgi:hypothetical protein